MVYFASAAKHESAIRAAEELNVSPPAISGAISCLESVLGEQLFIRRHARGLVLTKEGRQLLLEVREIVDRVHEIESARKRAQPHQKRPIFLGCLGDIAPAILPPLVRGFADRHADVEIKWSTGEYGPLMQRLKEGNLDLVIALDFESTPTLRNSVLHRTPALCVLPEGHRLAGGAIDLAALAGEPFILLDIPRTRDYFLSVFGTRGLQPSIAHRVASADMVRSLVANGFGYSLLNFMTPSSHRAVYCPIVGEDDPSSLVAIHHFKRRISSALEDLIDLTRETVAQSRICG
ncbi:LysR substrate-binding domain-containing protein [Azospirillum sp. ST 5-10]|uniref:LysR substrate-binding domain-containing protein n=1 Tax=unclassified Azospirillum TaxID=2630922 RepID=UPI003F49D28E